MFATSYDEARILLHLIANPFLCVDPDRAARAAGAVLRRMVQDARTEVVSDIYSRAGMALRQYIVLISIADLL